MLKNEYVNVKPWTQPLDLLKKESFICEMTTEDLGFLLGLIKQKRPNKIVEVGVAEGGTTGVIVRALNMLNYKTTMYSVDITKKYYADNTLSTGYEYSRLSKHFGNLCNHKFLFGKTLAGQIDSIGKNIDFAILDTTHAIPGELLDVLTLLPYMNPNGIIILHDVELSRIRAIDCNNPWHNTARFAVATKIALLSIISEEKYLNTNNCGIENLPLCNIAGLKINEQTIKNPYNIFYALTLPWSYHLSEVHANEYRNIFRKHYDLSCNQCFESAVAYSIFFDEV